MKKKIGRNELCFCGSGKKYKKCCYLNKGKNNTPSTEPPIKISEAILKISEHLIKKYPQRERITVLIDLAVAAWNISLTSGEKRENIESKIIDLMPEELDAITIATLIEQTDMLVERKNKLFPDIRHFIVNYDLSFGGDGKLTLDINSSPTDGHDVFSDSK